MTRTLRRRYFELLDRPGGRWLLARMATTYFRRATGMDVSVFFDEIWLRRSGSRFQGDGRRFEYYAEEIARMDERMAAQDREAEDYWFQTIRPAADGTIIDVGAGSGTDMAAFCKAVGPRGKILAIEAHPDTFLALRKTCEHNQLENVICVHAAVLDRPGTVFIEDSPDHETNRVETSPGKAGYGISVPATTVDDLCSLHAIDRVDLLKMNIEGAERLAIHGMKRTIDRTRCAVIACHDFRAERGELGGFSTKDDVVAFLVEHGFEAHVRKDDPRPFVRDHVHATRSSGARTGMVRLSSPDS